MRSSLEITLGCLIACHFVGNVAATADAECFLSVGDWGSSNSNVQRVASAMQKFVKSGGSDPSMPQCNSIKFVATLGDHVYHFGISHPEDDELRERFHQFYRHPELQVPWVAVLGNHDYGEFESIGSGNAQAQVDYGLLNVGRDTWTMPHFYHTHDADFGAAGILRVVAIDTTALEQCLRYGRHSHRCMHAEQQDWIESTLAEASANASIAVIIVIGHHNVASATHYNNEQLEAYLVPLFRTTRVSLHAFGHMHVGAVSVDGGWSKHPDEAVVYMCNGLGLGERPYHCKFDGWENRTKSSMSDRWCSTYEHNIHGGFAVHRVWRDAVSHRVMLEHCFISSTNELMHCHSIVARPMAALQVPEARSTADL